ncbi:GntR family transcriptional regulator [Phaeobacter gallaeciensis]|uniref:GntR family transcriptional regulator n=2 Tax=Roseobacteraceae TaxID=2854170 RepID=A0A366XC80_9RHOB|nr:UTRA domain-containing protein [Falsiruegeria litorea]MBT3142324.1 GntR family transcriptional regulator [Falsiruegeria litorea]MBT8169448.1 GntR family transcriptional regulator [Falsiruegeria litorea]RBW60672.1 GntR family transcriptional regulator [Phaeobacter gallaeciensis]
MQTKGHPVPAKKVSFQDVRDEVIRRIQDRVWPQGTLLPTEFELAEEFGCARATVNRAMRELADRGIVDRKRKSGTRVNTAPVKQAKFEIAVVRHLVEEKNAQYRYSLLQLEQIPAPAWLSSRLDLPNDAQALHIKCMHYADNRPFQFEERWINIAAVPDVLHQDFKETGPNEWLLSEVPFSNAEIGFSAIATDATLTEFLATQPATPVIQMERTTWFQNQPVTFVRMTFHPGYRMSTSY